MVHREVETTRPFFPRELVFDVGHVGYASMAYAAWLIPFPRELVFDVESCKSHAKGLSLWQADVASWEILYVFFLLGTSSNISGPLSSQPCKDDRWFLLGKSVFLCPINVESFGEVWVVSICFNPEFDGGTFYRISLYSGLMLSDLISPLNRSSNFDFHPQWCDFQNSL